MGKYVIIAAILWMTYSPCLGQQKPLTVADAGERINTIIKQHYKPDSSAVKQTCREGFFLMKLLVDNRGKISGVHFSADTSWFVNEALVKSLSFIEKDKELISTIKKWHKPIVIPVQYLYNRGCKPAFSTPQSTLEDRYKAAIASLQAIRSSQHYLEDIYHMADFGEHGKSSFECILLKPLYFEENEPPGY